jgi:hypothetical protein
MGSGNVAQVPMSSLWPRAEVAADEKARLGDADSEVPRDVRNQPDYGEFCCCDAEGGDEQGEKRQGHIDLPGRTEVNLIVRSEQTKAAFEA